MGLSVDVGLAVRVPEDVRVADRVHVGDAVLVGMGVYSFVTSCVRPGNPAACMRPAGGQN